MSINLSKKEVSESCGDYSTPKKQKMFRHPFSFKGRIRRLEYFVSNCFSYVLLQAINLVTDFVPDKDASSGETVVLLVMFAFYLVIIWFSLAQGVKRCHDMGHNGWFVLIPFYGLWMLCCDGEKHANKYGPDPKGRNEQ